MYDLPEQDSLFQSNEVPIPEKLPEDEKRPVRAYQRGTAKKQRAIDLLQPIVDAQTDNVLRSRVLAMDETPIKAGPY